MTMPEVQAVYDQVHGQDATRKFSVAEVKEITYPLINVAEATRQEAEEWQAMYEEEQRRFEKAQADLRLMTGQRDRLRKAMLDMGVRPDIVDLIQNFGATIEIEKTDKP